MSTYGCYYSPRPYSDELYHYGILGMKWGVRRYQNPDGTRTALGKRRERKGGALDEDAKNRKAKRKRAAAIGAAAGGAVGAMGLVGKAAVNKVNNDEKTKKAIGNWFDSSIKDGKDKPNISPAEKVLKESKKVGEGASNISRKIQSKKDARHRAEEKEKKKKEMAKLSDDELRKRINRLNLEKQYSDLTRDETDLGKWTVQERIDLATDIGAIALNLVTIGTTVYLAKKKAGG